MATPRDIAALTTLSTVLIGACGTLGRIVDGERVTGLEADAMRTLLRDANGALMQIIARLNDKVGE